MERLAVCGVGGGGQGDRSSVPRWSRPATVLSQPCRRDRFLPQPVAGGTAGRGWCERPGPRLLSRSFCAAWAPNPLLGMAGLEGKPLQGATAPSVRQSWHGALLPPWKGLHLLSTAQGAADPALGPALPVGDAGDGPGASVAANTRATAVSAGSKGLGRGPWWAVSQNGAPQERWPEACPVAGGWVTLEDSVPLCNLLEPLRDYWTRGAGGWQLGSAMHRGRGSGHRGHGRRQGGPRGVLWLGDPLSEASKLFTTAVHAA